MAYTYFPDENHFHNDIEEYINGYINLFEISEAYPMYRVIGALQEAYNNKLKEYDDDSGWNKITILSAKHVVEIAIEEVEEDYPREKFPELWI